MVIIYYASEFFLTKLYLLTEPKKIRLLLGVRVLSIFYSFYKQILVDSGRFMLIDLLL